MKKLILLFLFVGISAIALAKSYKYPQQDMAILKTDDYAFMHSVIKWKSVDHVQTSDCPQCVSVTECLNSLTDWQAGMAKIVYERVYGDRQIAQYTVYYPVIYTDYNTEPGVK